MKTFRLFAWLLFGLLVGPVAYAQGSEPDGMVRWISGMVTDADGQPLSGVRVLLWKPDPDREGRISHLGESVTDEDGSYAIEIEGTLPDNAMLQFYYRFSNGTGFTRTSPRPSAALSTMNLSGQALSHPPKRRQTGSSSTQQPGGPRSFCRVPAGLSS